jgi:hypothetical protein
MRPYSQQHRFYCGVDLHARTLFLHVLDHDGQARFEKNIFARRDYRDRVAKTGRRTVRK